MKRLGIYNLLILFLLVIALATLGIAAEKHGAMHAYKAALTGAGEIPKVATTAKGTAIFEPEMGGMDLHYKVTVDDIENVTASHIHLGKKGKNGPPVAGLFAGPKKEGKFTGILAEGTITDKDLVGPLAGKTVKDLIKDIKKGELYVNVHTTKDPDGEIRGEIK